MRLEISHISKKLKQTLVLDDVSLSVDSGTVCGIVGRNGSGKTMLFRAISGLIHTDSGTVRWDGRLLHKDFDVLPSLGIILENADLYPDYSCLKNLQLLAGLRKIADQAAISESIRRVGLDPADSRPYRKYSLGMKQRAKIAQAIMEKPDVLILDEPTNALDTEGVALIRQIINQEKQRGALVLLASHSQEDIRLLSDQVYHMSNGRLSRPVEG
ncbi:MAG: ABC transporter ATP-binding protein [Oscillospiraceae bacterium]|nr:ABC transporter ATP-binding protein [Oscillospiraceae bacterium]